MAASSSRQPESESGPGRPKAESLAPFLNYRLSPSSREALERANAFRLEQGADRLHMEHLLVGLLMKHPGPAQEVFAACGVTRDDVIARLGKVDKQVPKPGEGRGFSFRIGRQRIDASTPISGHVREAMASALDQARAFGDPVEIQSRDLLLGVSSVKRCSVVRAFGDVFERAPGIVASMPNPKRDRRRPSSSPARKGDSPEQTSSIPPVEHEAVEQGVTPDAVEQQAVEQDASQDGVAGGADDPRPGRQPESDLASRGRGDGATNDRPEQAEDRLDFRHYIDAFADLVQSPDTKPPITIGIFGAWGAGKSFLLWHLQQELRRREEEDRRTLAKALRQKPLHQAPAIAFRHVGARLTSAVTGAWNGATDTLGFWNATLRARWRGDDIPTRKEAEDREARRIHTVTFNAWEYSATERIWPRLVRAILEHVERDVRWSTRPRLAAEKLVRKLRYNVPRKLRSGWMDLAAWLAVGAALAFVALKVKPLQQGDALTGIFGAGAGADFTIPALAGALTAFAKLLKDSILAPLGGWMTALLDDGVSYGGQIDYMAAMKADLDLLERRLDKGRARVLVMIDDLDRCDPDKMIHVLQAVNLLLDRKNFVVCLGVDARVVTAAVEKHYKDLLGPAGISGYEYLDKIVQIPFRIPEPTREQLVQFLDKQLGGANGAESEPVADSVSVVLPTGQLAPTQVTTGGETATTGTGSIVTPPTPASTPAAADAAPTTSAAAPAVRENVPLTFSAHERRAFAAVAPFLRPNPRHINRLVNVYALVRSLTETRGESGLVGGPESTVRWLVLAAQWPYTVRQMLVRLDQLLRETPPTDGATWRPASARTDDRALGILHRSATIDRRLQQQYDYDEARLAALVADCSFVTWNQLRLLRRYTLNFNPALEAELAAAAEAVRDRRTNLALRREVARGQQPRKGAPAAQGGPPQPLPNAKPSPNPTAAHPS